MIYLSDKIFFTKDFGNITAGTTLDYVVSIRVHGINPSTKEKYTFSPIYYGRLTVLGGTQRILLNDIIEPHMYDHQYLKSDTTSTDYGAPYYIDVQITFPSLNDSTTITNILQYYKDAETPKGQNWDDATPTIYNVLNQRTTILPRVPRLETTADNFFFGALLYGTEAYWTNNTKFSFLGIKDSTIYIKKIITSRGSTIAKPYANIDYQKLVGVEANVKIDEIWVGDADYNKITKLADVDECPSDYYLIWMDRTGAYQCQPFTKKVIHSESISNTTITNEYEEMRPAITSIQNKWTLNSDWLNENEYKAYESIFVSPYLYLYNTKLDEGYWVNCDTKQWTSKNHKNNKGLFNLSLTVSSIATQNITY